MPVFVVEAMDVLKINDLELNDGISYAVMHDGFTPRPATVRQQFSDSPFTAGQKYRKRLSKPENQELNFRVKVLGTSKDDMDAKLHAIYDEIVKDESVITWRPDQREDYSYWTAYGSPTGEVDTYFSYEWQTAEICVLSWMMIALPGPLGDWEELAPVWCLGDDNSFEKDDGADLQFWTVVATGAATWAKEAGAGNFLHGLQSLRMNCLAGETVTATEKTYIQVEELDHFDRHDYAKKLSGTGDVDYSLICFDVTDAVTGTVDLLTGDDPTGAFLDRLSISAGQGIMHPSDSGDALKFPVGTTQVKRVIKQSGLGTILFDDLYFANSEYAPDNKIRPTMGLVIPGADIPGNLPADADLYFSHPYAQLCWAAQGLPDAGKNLTGVSFVDATHGWAVAASGEVYFWNGSSWTLQDTLAATLFAYGIFAFDANNVWVCGLEKVWYFNGVIWDAGTSVKVGIQWYDLWGNAANSVWVVGESGEIYFWNGVVWAAQVSGTVNVLKAIDGFAANNVWAVGNNGVGTHWNGAAWALDSPPGANWHYGVAALDATHIWACGFNGRIYFNDGGGWVLQETLLTLLRSIYVFDANNVWAIGNDGIIAYFDGTTWEQQCSATSETLSSVAGFDASNVWAVGEFSTVRVNWMIAEAVPFTDIWVGQRNDYHADYSPVVQPSDGAVAYLYTRMDSDYRTLAAAATAQARFLLEAHEGSHLLTMGITFSGATAFDKCNVKLLLQTPQGVDITGDEVEIEIDMGDPNTVWQEVAMLATRFDPIALPSHYARADAGAIYEVVRITADAALAAVELWLDHIALIPVDRYCEIAYFDKNSLILSSHEKRAVLSSLNGTLAQAQEWNAAKKIGTPRFVMSSAGLNMAVCQVFDDYGISGDHQCGEHGIPANLVIRWRPRYYLTPPRIS